MTDYAHLVSEIYRIVGKWALVAVECGDAPDRKGYYWQIAHGVIRNPHKTVKTAILDAASRLLLPLVSLTKPPRDLHRRNVKIPLGLFKRMKLLKKQRGLTWTEWMEKALELMGIGAIDFHLYLERHRKWSKETFGEGQRTEGNIDHILKELEEIRAEPDSLEEWCDVALLALDGAWRAGYSPSQIIEMLRKKQEKNFKRKWSKPTVGHAVEHIRMEG